MKTKFLAICLLFLLLLSGCAKAEETGSEGRTFRAGGLEIVLDTSFAEAYADGYEGCYTSEHVDVFILKENFSLSEELKSMSLSDYATAMIQGNSLSGSKLKEDGDLVYFDYQITLATGKFCYVSYLYKTEKAFWTVQFAVPELYREQLKTSLSQWARSVSFYE